MVKHKALPDHQPVVVSLKKSQIIYGAYVHYIVAKNILRVKEAVLCFGKRHQICPSADVKECLKL